MRFSASVFSQISFSHGPEYPMGAISNFYNSGHKWVKLWDRKFFHVWFRSYWVAVYTSRVNFSKTFILGWRQADISPTVLSHVLLLPAIIQRRRHGIDENQGQDVITSVNDNGNNLSPVTFIASVVYIGEQLTAGVVDTGIKRKNSNISTQRIFVKKFDTVTGMGSGPMGIWFMENLNTPFKLIRAYKE